MKSLYSTMYQNIIKKKHINNNIFEKLNKNNSLYFIYHNYDFFRMTNFL